MDGSKIVPVEPPGRLKPTALQNRIQDTDGSCTFELELLSGFIIIHQKRTVNDGENVTTVVVPVICHQFPGNIRKLLADTLSADAVGGGEHF